MSATRFSDLILFLFLLLLVLVIGYGALVSVGDTASHSSGAARNDRPEEFIVESVGDS